MRATRSFPGRRFGLSGVDLDAGGYLTQAEIDACPSRGMIYAVRPGAPHEATDRCWLLASGATFSGIPWPERMAAVAVIRNGGNVMLLAERQEDEVAVREGLVAALNGPTWPSGG